MAAGRLSAASRRRLSRCRLSMLRDARPAGPQGLPQGTRSPERIQLQDSRV